MPRLRIWSAAAVALLTAVQVFSGTAGLTAPEAVGAKAAAVTLRAGDGQTGRLAVDTTAFAEAVGPVAVTVERADAPGVRLSGQRLPAAVQVRPQTTGELPVTGLPDRACLGVALSAVVETAAGQQRRTATAVVGTGTSAEARRCPSYADLPQLSPEAITQPATASGPGEGSIRVTGTGAFTRHADAWVRADRLDRRLTPHPKGGIARGIRLDLDRLSHAAQQQPKAGDWLEVRVRSASRVELINPADPHGAYRHPGRGKTVTMRVSDPAQLAFDAVFAGRGPRCLGLDVAAAGAKKPLASTTLHYGESGEDARSCADPRGTDPDPGENDPGDDNGDGDGKDGDRDGTDGEGKDDGKDGDGSRDGKDGDGKDGDGAGSRDGAGGSGRGENGSGPLSAADRKSLAAQGAVFGSEMVASGPVPGMPLVQTLNGALLPGFGLMCTPAADNQRVQVRSGLTQLAITHDFAGPSVQVSDMRTPQSVTRKISDVDYVLPEGARLPIDAGGLGDFAAAGDDVWASSHDGRSAPAIGIAATGQQLRGTVTIGLDTVAGPGKVALVGTDEFGHNSILADGKKELTLTAGSTEFPRFAFTQPGTYTVNTLITAGNGSAGSGGAGSGDAGTGDAGSGKRKNATVVPLHFSVGEVSSPLTADTALGALLGTCTDVSMASTLAKPDLPPNPPAPEAAPPVGGTEPAAWTWLLVGLGMGLALTAAGWGALLLIRTFSTAGGARP